MNQQATTIRFDDAWEAAKQFVHEKIVDSRWGQKLVLLRDVSGQIRLAFDDRKEEAPFWLCDEQTIAELHLKLGFFSPGHNKLILLAQNMFAPEAIFESPDLVEDENHLWVLERRLIGTDWIRQVAGTTNSSKTIAGKRITFFGIKGGVGRSTAAAVLAWRLSLAEKRVLILDLDLESSGIGTTMLPPDRQPKYGIVDWFVEDGVNQADDKFMEDMLGLSPLGKVDRIQVIPAGGKLVVGYDYLAKLARAYIPVARPEGIQAFSQQLIRLIEQAESVVKPDVTIIDSRAGIHDIAAVAVTQINADSLLFAIDTPQTWEAYRILFSEWKKKPLFANTFRQALKMVAATVPETGSEEYLKRIRVRCYDLFAENLYEEISGVAESDQSDPFNYDPDDESAPHFPLPIYWTQRMRQFNPFEQSEGLDVYVKLATDEFCSSIMKRLR